MLGFKSLDSSDENNLRNRNNAYDSHWTDRRYSICPSEVQFINEIMSVVA